MDCPLNCKDGKVFNRVSHRFENCPHCAELRAKQVRGDELCDGGLSITELLKVPERYTGLSFSIDLLIPSVFQQSKLIPESVLEVEGILKALLADVTLGEVPKRTYMFNLGECADISAFVYPYLLKGYKAGLKVAPLVHSLELQRLRNKLESSFESEEYRPSVLDQYGDNYDDYVDADVCVVVLDAGASIRDLNAVRGLVDNRAFKNKATIIFTYAYFERLFGICTHGDERSLRLATLVQVKYKRNQSNDNRQGTQSRSNQTVLSFAQEFGKRDLDPNIGVTQEGF